MTTQTIASAIALSAAAGLAAPAAATLTLNSGDAEYSNTVPTSATAGTGGTGNFEPDSGTDHLFRLTWHWRTNGVDTRELVFSSAAGFNFTEAGSGTPTGTQSWTGLDGGRFDALLTSSLTDGAAPGEAMLVQTMAITNVSGGVLDMALFSFADFNVSGQGPGDTAILLSLDTIEITDSPDFAQHQGIGASNYAVANGNGLFSLLTDASINNLGNTGLPSSAGDYTGAWQWNNNAIANGATVTFTAVYSINMAVPAPGALVLLGFGGLAARRRRRA